MRKLYFNLFLIIISLTLGNVGTFAQITERARPAEWAGLVEGARFMDRFLPMPQGKLSSDTWGARDVIPRYIDNGIEDQTWSYWGGNILQGDDNKYHLFVCGWLESSEKGHMEWGNSIVFHAVCNNSTGPFIVQDTIGKGHNPEAFRLNDGRYVIYVIEGYYIADKLNGPWKYAKFDFNPRDRRIIEGLSNLTFARREDGSYLMVCRGGGVWFSQTGISTYNQVTDKRVYPAVAGEFEDPVVWRDHIKYHLIVNDWLGRIAFYLRSKDGVNWIADPGEAYTTGFSRHEDGQVENWFKYERIKILQDEYGRAIQANFAVIDTLKHLDMGSDNHSSKNISIPLNLGLLLTVVNKKPITAKTKTIELKIQAEDNFNPHTDIDLNSLRFGASAEVNYGRGCKVASTKKSGNDLIVVFDAEGHGITDTEFALKLIGKAKDGSLLYGYSRLPWLEYIEPILSARAPKFTPDGNNWKVSIEVQNFGQVASTITDLKLEYIENGNMIKVGDATIPILQAWEKKTLNLKTPLTFDKNKEYKFLITIGPSSKNPTTLTIKKSVVN